ncbi:MAG: NifU family protein [Ilumatobacter sp.]|uniref:NifU family protein n=1 Tax=Ilumatobacter sp. TaxID=1967498 RepID=UPI002614AF65|nr:NifU family protein [Ilumatobacter sp.]MDJ0771347.1 NifU family protein [Ilumatobacter sp.]
MTIEAERTASAPGAAEVAGPGFDDLAAGVDAALGRVVELDGDARDVADELRAAIEAFHRPALVHIVRTLRDDPRGKELLFELVDDPAVRAVLGLHGIIRPDPTTRAERALTTVRPYLQSHGGDVELVAVEGSVATVRLHGSCNGCSMSAVTLREVVSEALVGQVDEVTELAVVDDEPTAAFIPLESVGIKRDAGWREAGDAAAIVPDTIVRIDLEGTSLIAVNVDGRIAVYRNECPHQGRTLDGGDCSDGVLRCPWHGFTFDAAGGECLSAPGAQLTQVPTRIDDGVIWVRVDA